LLQRGIRLKHATPLNARQKNAVKIRSASARRALTSTLTMTATPATEFAQIPRVSGSARQSKTAAVTTAAIAAREKTRGAINAATAQSAARAAS
jgi:hypothetical protein